MSDCFEKIMRRSVLQMLFFIQMYVEMNQKKRWCFRGKEIVFDFHCILYNSYKLLFKTVTIFWLLVLFNLFKYVLKVNYLSFDISVLRYAAAI